MEISILYYNHKKEKKMKKMKFSVFALSLVLLFTSCGDLTNKAKGGMIGGASGGALGALIGQLAGNGKGAAIGAGVGTAVGAGVGVLIGNRMDKAKAAAEAVENAKAETIEDSSTGLKYVKVTFDSGILFTTGDATLSSSARTSLSKFASTVLNTNTDMDVAIVGFTDNQGWRNCTAAESKQKNVELSQKRADAVYSYLVSSGAKTSQIKYIKGLGEDNPVASNDTKAGQEQNRRVEVYLYASQEMINAAQQQAGTTK